MFTHLPAEQDDATLDFAGKIEQTDVEVFNLDSNGINFGESVFSPSALPRSALRRATATTST